MLQYISAITASLQGASKILACAAYASPYIAGILHMIEVLVCFLLGNSPASEFYVPTFWNTVCSIFIGMKNV